MNSNLGYRKEVSAGPRSVIVCACNLLRSLIVVANAVKLASAGRPSNWLRSVSEGLAANAEARCVYFR